MDSAQSGSLIITARCWCIGHWIRHNPEGCGNTPAVRRVGNMEAKPPKSLQGTNLFTAQKHWAPAQVAFLLSELQKELEFPPEKNFRKWEVTEIRHTLCASPWCRKNSYNWGREDSHLEEKEEQEEVYRCVCSGKGRGLPELEKVGGLCMTWRC